jgi:hypothetical protein
MVGGRGEADPRPTRRDRASSDAVGFCTIADATYFPGLVALVNSLRLHGHHERVTVVDLGLSDRQRREVASECDFVSPPRAVHAWLLAPQALAAVGADVAVYLDCDVVVTAPLDDVFDDARVGKLCAFPDRLADRWFAEWEDLFHLPTAPRRQPYRNAGFVALAPAAFPGLLDRWTELCAALEGTAVDELAVDHRAPAGLPDQDALNALLMSVVDPGCIAPYDAGAISQGNRELAATRVVDVRTVTCARGGRRVRLLHCFSAPKPWEPAARGYLPDTAYLRCLRRLLVGPDLAVRTDERSAPWLVPGVRGAVALRRFTARAALRPRTRWRALRARRPSADG